MPRPPAPPATALGVALQTRRDTSSMEALSLELHISQPSLSRIERGISTPSYPTALILARWLGWTVEQVMEAAGQRVEGRDG